MEGRAVETLARRLGVSSSHFQHLLRRDLGATYGTLLRSRRVEYAKETLEQRPHLSLSEIALECGYTPQAMYRHFVREFGRPPSDIGRRSA
jgi:AraC family transcriptional regulator of adaptative response / DNA-3-methyladenine glycosylase II